MLILCEFLFFFYFFLSLLIFLVCVSFLVLLERFLLGLSQNRPGPRVVGLYGLLQTLVDGGKLFTKTATLSLPLLPAGLFFTLGLCSVSYATTYESGWLPTLLCISLLSLAVLVASRSNGSTWGLVAANRVMLMALSFDVVFSFFLISLLFVSRFDSLIGVLCLLTICLMELGRTPYDLVEGESELVSGYNVEYGGFGFVLLFLGEYLGFYWIAGILCHLVGFSFILVVVLHLGLIMIRAVLPRYKMNHVLWFSWGILNLVCFYMFLISLHTFTNRNGYRLSSLGLIIRSSIPALTLVLAGSVLILLNRWVNGNWEDVVQTIGGHPLNTSLDGSQNAVSSDICLFLYGVAIVLGLIHLLNLLKLFCNYFSELKGPSYEDSAHCINTFFFGSCIISLGLAVCTLHVNIYVMLLLFYLYILTLNAYEYLMSKNLNLRLRGMSQIAMFFVCRPWV